jgi:tetratricopeptide (TPR) repeat protein
LLAEGEFALVQEELEAALSLSGQPVKRGTMAHEHIVYMMLTDTAAQLSDASETERYLSKLEPLAQRDDHRPYQAVAQRARGIVYRLKGELDEAESHLKQALELFGDFNAAWQIGRTHCELAELEMAREDQKKASDHYERALVEFDRIQALPDIKRTRSALEAIELPT